MLLSILEIGARLLQLGKNKEKSPFMRNQSVIWNGLLARMLNRK